MKKEVKKKTRWVKCHTAFQDFEDLYEALLLCLESIAQEIKKVHRYGTVSSNQEPYVRYCLLHCQASFSGFTVGLSRSLQGLTLDLIETCKYINVEKEQLEGVRKNAKTAFTSFVYEKIKKMANKANVKVSIPRYCGMQTLRNNTNARIPDAYFLPFSVATCWSK